MQLKPLNPEEFTMKIVKDLGMKKPTENYYKKVRMAVFECCNCKRHFEAVVSTKAKKQKYCKHCNGTDRRKEHRDHPLYSTWADTKFKLRAKKTTGHYTTYVLRNITMCKEWEDSYDAFYEWAINSGWKDGLTIDRIDNSKGYYPENCRWVDWYVQAANKRVIRVGNTTGYKGIIKTPAGRFAAQIRYRGIVYLLGVYNTNVEAAKAYDSFVKLMNFPHTVNDVLEENEIVYPKHKGTLQVLKDKGIYISNNVSKEP